MRRLGLVIGVAVAVVASILIIIFVRFDVNHYRTQIQTEMEQRLGRKVALGNLKLRLIPLRLRVENLAISEDPDFAGHTPFLKADTVDLSVRLLPLLGNKVKIGAIDLQRPSVEVVKNAQGVWNFSSLGHGSQQTSSGSATGVIMEGNLTLHDGQIAVTSLQRRESRKIYDHIDMTLRDFAPGKPFSIDAVARISSQGGQEISLQGKVGPLSEIAANRTPFDGTLSLKRVAISGLRNFLNTPVLAKTDGIVSGETDIKTENGKLGGVGSVKLENVRINGLDVGYPITAQYSLAADPVTNVITIVSSTIGLGSAPVSVRGSVNLQPTPAELDLKVGSEGASIGEVTRPEILQEVEQKTPELFCVGFIPPGGLSASRHVSKLLRARLPELTIVVGHWGLHEKVHNDREALLAAGATYVAATLIETRDQIAQAMHPHVKLSPIMTRGLQAVSSSLGTI